MKITLDLEEKIIEIEGKMNLDKLLIELEKMNIDYTEWEIQNCTFSFSYSTPQYQLYRSTDQNTVPLWQVTSSTQ